MQSRIDEQTAKAQFSEIMDLAGRHDQRFTVSRPGGPTVVILSMQDYLRETVPAPDWLERAWAGAKERGIDTMTMDEIDAEIAEYRREKAAALEQARRRSMRSLTRTSSSQPSCPTGEMKRTF